MGSLNGSRRPGRVFAAVDLGASGGRVTAGIVDGGRATLRQIHRFPNGIHERDGHLRWDINRLYAEVLAGLARLAAEFPQVESVGIDTWAVDYGLLDRTGTLLADPVAYRDDRTSAVIDRVHRSISPDDLYRLNGLQFLPFNTIYQLAAEKEGALWERAAHVVLLPDLLAYWLTGALRTEATNASTTGLLDLHTGDWSTTLLDVVGVPSGMLPPIEVAGEVRGRVRPGLCARLGLSRGTPVTTVGSHDTASAVVALPATGRRFAYVASGTWSLVGLELDHPVVTPESRAANFTNEGGVDGRTRFLRNAGGLWLMQESMRAWAAAGETLDVPGVIAAAAALPSGGPTIDVDDPVFMAPGDMPHRIAAAIGARRGPLTPPETVRCVIDSLAACYATTVDRAAALAGADVAVIHLVGGGAQNDLLGQLTADLAGVPVTAGPVEATALGNVLVQARAHGAAPLTLEELRSELSTGPGIRTFQPAS